jgi:TRAP-type C4-dicarboxylate transport system permease small subunit
MIHQTHTRVFVGVLRRRIEAMKRVSAFLFSILNVTLAILLAAMCIVVFANVVLRYAFNSGLTWAEESARYMMIYMVFLGAVGAVKNNEHLGVDFLVRKLPRLAKRGAYLLVNATIVYMLYLIFDGCLKLVNLNKNSTSSGTGLPLSVIYLIGLIFTVCMILIIIMNMIRVIIDKNAIDTLGVIAESEEEFMIQEIKDGMQEDSQLEPKHETQSGGGART